MGDGVAEPSKVSVATLPAPVRSRGHGRHFSSGKSRCPENKCRHPPPVHGRYLKVPKSKILTKPTTVPQANDLCCRRINPNKKKNDYYFFYFIFLFLFILQEDNRPK